jgi:hypothetical protein
LFDELLVILEPFVSLQGLKEVAHGWDTNPNESMNNTIAWFAPKGKTYSGTNSLRVRISIAISIQSLGYDECFLRIFKDLGLDMDAITAHRMKMNETGRHYRQMQARSLQRKRVQQEANHAKIKKYFEKLATDRSKGKQYKTASALDGVLSMATTNQSITANNKRRRTDYSKITCPFCGVHGHVTRKSKYCIAIDQSDAEILSIMENTANEEDTPDPTTESASRAQEEVSLLDEIDCVPMFSHNLYQLECSLENQD